jgi:hypothetical protein
MVFRFAISILGQQIGMHINQFEFIFLSIMDEFHPINYYLIQIINEIHPCKKTFIHGHIHPYRWIKITLSSKLKL